MLTLWVGSVQYSTNTRTHFSSAAVSDKQARLTNVEEIVLYETK